jgi:hypothetical protein
LLLLLMLLSAPAQNAGPKVELSALQESLRSVGPKVTLRFVFDDEARWDSLLDTVAKGDNSWLEVAASLREVSDAHASETLDMAIQEALPLNSSSAFQQGEAFGEFVTGPALLPALLAVWRGRRFSAKRIEWRARDSVRQAE